MSGWGSWQGGYGALTVAIVFMLVVGCERAHGDTGKERAAEAVHQYFIASGTPGAEKADLAFWTAIELYDTPENKCLDGSEHSLYYEFNASYREDYHAAANDPDHWIHHAEQADREWREQNEDLAALDDEWRRRLKAELSGRQYYLLLSVPNGGFGHIICMYVDKNTWEVVQPESMTGEREAGGDN